MTYRQFLTALRKTRKRFPWHLYYGMIRQSEGIGCPISAITGDWADWIDPDHAGILTLRLRTRIVRAGDAERQHSPRIRRDLLRALGLKERT